MKLWQTIRADLYRYCGDADGRAWLKEYLRTPGFRYMFYLRKVTVWAPAVSV
jgi:serine O-acetyltransferase